MKKSLLLMPLFMVLLFNSCKTSTDTKPANTITEPNSITLKLSWTSEGSSSIYEDLDLLIYSGLVNSSNTATEFKSATTTSKPEILTAKTSDFGDGNYTIAVKQDYTYSNGKLKVELTGSSTTGKAYLEYDYIKENSGKVIYIFKLKKSGNDFTLSNL